MMTKMITWGLLSYGLMNIMVYGSIFQGLRNFLTKWGDDKNAPLNFLGKFISGILVCPMCFSTWGGFLLGLVIYSPTNVTFGVPVEFSWFFDGILSSGFVWALNSIIEWFESKK